MKQANRIDRGRGEYAKGNAIYRNNSIRKAMAKAQVILGTGTVLSYIYNHTDARTDGSLMVGGMLLSSLAAVNVASLGFDIAVNNKEKRMRAYHNDSDTRKRLKPYLK